MGWALPLVERETERESENSKSNPFFLNNLLLYISRLSSVLNFRVSPSKFAL